MSHAALAIAATAIKVQSNPCGIQQYIVATSRDNISTIDEPPPNTALRLAVRPSTHRLFSPGTRDAIPHMAIVTATAAVPVGVIFRMIGHIPLSMVKP